MIWTLITSLSANAVLIYLLLSEKKRLKEYDVAFEQLAGQLGHMKQIVEDYEKTIHQERAQLQYILMGFLQHEEILSLQKRAVWLEELQERLKQVIQQEEKEAMKEEMEQKTEEKL